MDKLTYMERHILIMKDNFSYVWMLAFLQAYIQYR